MMPAPQYYTPMMYAPMAMPQPGYAPMQMSQTGVQTPVVSPASSHSGEMPMMGNGLQYCSSEYLFQLAQTGTRIVPEPQPHYPQQALISVKPADQMNVFETMNWVELIGETQGWPEASTYAHAFCNNGLNGFMLSQLKMEDLEKMGVEKHGHRLVLMSAIHMLYPYLQTIDRTNSNLSSAAPSLAGDSSYEQSEEEACDPLPQLTMTNSARRRSVIVGEGTCLLNQRNLVAHEKKMETIQLRRPQLIDESSCTSNNSMSSMLSASSQVTESSVTSSLNGDRRCQLTLTLPKPPACNIQAIRSIQQDLANVGLEAHPRPSEKAANKFIVRFMSESEAQRALKIKDQLGYDLSDYTEFSRKKGPRPTPSNPQKYMVLHQAQVRSGKSMKSKVLGNVKKGDVYWVNQVKGKRARLVERSESGDHNIGWVSLRNNAGFKYLQKLPVNASLQ